LCTKELAADLLQAAAEQGIYIDCVPFIEMQALPESVLQTQLAAFSGSSVSVVFTSANAVASVARLGLDSSNWCIYCINGLTWKKVEQTFPKATIAGVATDGKSLAETMLHDPQHLNKVLFCCGNRRRNELPAMLKAAGIDVTEVVVYNTVLRPVVVSEDYEGYIFFSPSGVESFLTFNQLQKDAIVFAIGETTAASLKDITEKIVISEVPDTAFLIKKMISHFTIDATYE
jgi:uroporphyrinogen-III synthase